MVALPTLALLALMLAGAGLAPAARLGGACWQEAERDDGAGQGDSGGHHQGRVHRADEGRVAQGEQGVAGSAADTRRNGLVS